MAFRVTNNDARPFNLPPEYGGGVLDPGRSVTVEGERGVVNDLIAGANFGRDTGVLSFTEVPDNTPGTIRTSASGFVPAAAGHWAGRPPRTLAEAVNRLAAAIHAGALLPNTPIP